MVEFGASIDGAASRALDAALHSFGTDMGKASALAPKQAAVQICISLRKRTKKADKFPAQSEWRAVYSKNPPCYLTYRSFNKDRKARRKEIANKTGPAPEKLEKPLHRWTLTRKIGTPAENTHDYFVYIHTKTKRGKVVHDKAGELAELKQQHLRIFHRGLAKVSWGKTIAEINGKVGVRWPRRKNDRRAPLDSVHGKYRTNGVSLVNSVAEIHNHLDYIEYALEPGAMDEALAAAANKLVFNLAMKNLRASGLSAKEARDGAKQCAEHFMRINAA